MRVGLAALAAAGLSCRQGPTSFCIIAEWNEQEVAVDQIEYSATIAAEQVLARTSRPDQPGGPRKSPQSLCVYLDDRFAGQEVSCGVKGLRQGTAAVQGRATVTLDLHQTAECRTRLARRDPGCDDGTREGFLDQGAFPNVAACGDQRGNKMLYADAKSRSGALCDPGWRFCAPAAISSLPREPDPTWSDSTLMDPCAWINRETDADRCEILSLALLDVCLFPFGSAGLAGTGECALSSDPMRPMCQSGWRMATALKEWNATSVKDGIACWKHATARCAAAPAGAMVQPQLCWLACCRE